MEHNLCVLIDFENIAAGAEKEGLGRFKLELVLRRLKDKGRILSARAYGDWGRFAKFKQDLLRLGISLMELTSYRGQEKNRADIALVVDAMELAYTRPHLDTFVVLSGDSDFTPLIMRLKELNKRVLGVGTRRSTSALLKDACDEFIFYDTLVKEQGEIYPIARREPEPREIPEEDDDDERGDEAASSLSQEEAFALIVETLKGLQHDTSGAISAGLVKASLIRKEPAFNETEYGYSTFTRMLEAAQKRGLLSLHRDERAGGVRVEIAADGGANVAAPHSEPIEDDEPDLPGLTGDAARLRQSLADAGVDPLPRIYRHTVVYEFADHVQDRMANKKRNTLLYTVGDIARRCRDTVPAVAPRYVRSVIQALAQAGELLHPEGKPARSPTAPFIIKKDGDGLLDALSSFYLRTLAEKGEKLDNSQALSQLLYGDDDHQLVVEEMVAWLMHEQAHEAANPTETPPREERPREERPREERAREERPRESREDRPRESREDRPREERGRDGRRDERSRDDRGRQNGRDGRRDGRRDDRPRDDRGRDDRRRDERPRDDRPREDRPRDDRGRRPDTAPAVESGARDSAPVIESSRQAAAEIAAMSAPPVESPLPVAAPVSRSAEATAEGAPAKPARTRKSKRSAEADAEPLPPVADGEAEAAPKPKRPRRARKTDDGGEPSGDAS